MGVSCNAHLMSRGKVEVKKEPAGRQLYSHRWRAQLCLYFLSFHPLISFRCPRFFPVYPLHIFITFNLSLPQPSCMQTRSLLMFLSSFPASYLPLSLALSPLLSLPLLSSLTCSVYCQTGYLSRVVALSSGHWGLQRCRFLFQLSNRGIILHLVNVINYLLRWTAVGNAAPEDPGEKTQLWCESGGSPARLVYRWRVTMLCHQPDLFKICYLHPSSSHAS